MTDDAVRIVTPLVELVFMFAADLGHAARVATAHRLDPDGRCRSCHAGGSSSGRTFGCTLGSAARTVLHST